MRYDNQLRYAENILQAYAGDPPFHTWLRNFFRDNPQMGSRDRRQVAALCYGYFRLGRAMPDIPMPQAIVSGLFLSSVSGSDMLEYFRPDWNAKCASPAPEKIKIIGAEYPTFRAEDIFPWTDHVSSGLDLSEFRGSFLRQPDIFLRVRPGHDELVTHKLTGHGIPFWRVGQGTLAFAGAVKLDSLLSFDQEVVVQDLSSQRTMGLFPEAGGKEKIWDCCAGSGGKSMMYFDRYPLIELTVSDIRKSILQNLQARFSMAGITGFRCLVADLTERPLFFPEPFDVILADVPCTGSGTWARTPESVRFFSPASIPDYSARQKKILANVIPSLAPGGKLVYITCSVFREENEDVIRFAEEVLGLRPLGSQIFSGSAEHADSMFVAVLEK